VSEEKGRCCCGRFVNDYLPVIINDKMHELLGTPGAFCGPVINHQLRDAQADLKRAREMQCVFLGSDRECKELATLRTENEQLKDALSTKEDRTQVLLADNERLQKALTLLREYTDPTYAAKLRARIAEQDDFIDRTSGEAELERDLAQQHYCHAHSDGDCTWEHCPQLRDGEPEKSGRHCPLDVLQNEREEWQEREEQLRARVAEQDEALCDAERTIGNGVTQLERLERERGRLESENERLNGAYETAHASRLHAEDCLTRAERERDEKHYAANLAERDRDAALERVKELERERDTHDHPTGLVHKTLYDQVVGERDAARQDAYERVGQLAAVSTIALGCDAIDEAHEYWSAAAQDVHTMRASLQAKLDAALARVERVEAVAVRAYQEGRHGEAKEIRAALADDGGE
jgi:hypothetical protein